MRPSNGVGSGESALGKLNLRYQETSTELEGLDLDKPLVSVNDTTRGWKTWKKRGNPYNILLFGSFWGESGTASVTMLHTCFNRMQVAKGVLGSDQSQHIWLLYPLVLARGSACAPTSLKKDVENSHAPFKSHGGKSSATVNTQCQTSGESSTLENLENTQLSAKSWDVRCCFGVFYMCAAAASPSQ